MDNLITNYKNMPDLFWNHVGGAQGNMVKTFDVAVGLEYIFRYQANSSYNLTAIIGYPDDETRKAKQLGILQTNESGYLLYDEFKDKKPTLKSIRFIPKTDKVKVLFQQPIFQVNDFNYELCPVLFFPDKQFD